MPKVIQFFTEHWGAPVIVSRGTKHKVEQLSGFAAIRDNRMIGLVTYSIKSEECEIVSLDSLEENKGIGSKLVEKVEETAREEHCRRVWLITTNDNIRAIRFYQKRGYDLKALHRFAVDEARKLKPEIPLYSEEQIPIRHELEFEKVLYI
ncbi:GNAT family N-acetyltransferase [Caldalkalibacillus thermarum TA2.A1]|nr:GNAT family N-acetyltransferase [Caldalkalibacillus thermarum]QZT33052.1 GNAT family N-acetyltransferase [Caldalkalibacillus thermarum TA2.A1]